MQNNQIKQKGNHSHIWHWTGPHLFLLAAEVIGAVLLQPATPARAQTQINLASLMFIEFGETPLPGFSPTVTKRESGLVVA